MISNSQPRFSIRSVISNSIESYRQNLWSFSILTFLSYAVLIIIVVAAVFFVIAFIGYFSVSFDNTRADPFEMLGTASTGQAVLLAVTTLIAAALGLAATQLSAAGICYGAIQHMRNQPVAFNACLARAFSVILPVLGVTIVFLLIVCAIGAVTYILASGISPWFSLIAVLLIPFAYIRFWVVIPIIVVERPDVRTAFIRSLQLTRGESWRIFVVVALLIVVSAVVSGMSDRFAETALGMILGLVIQIVIATFVSIVSAIGYVELRRAKEGFEIEDIAAVFD